MNIQLLKRFFFMVHYYKCSFATAFHINLYICAGLVVQYAWKLVFNSDGNS